jgi:hypothetical protein
MQAYSAGGVPVGSQFARFPFGIPWDFLTCVDSGRRMSALYCLSYSPFPKRLNTLKPAFLACEIERDLGELKVDQTFRTGFLHAGQFVSGLADTGRRSVNLPPHTGQFPSQSSYSYNGIAKNSKFEYRNPKQPQNPN